MNADLLSPETERVGPRRSVNVDRPSSNSNSLDLIERDLIASSIVELCRTRAFMRRHGLSVTQRAPGFEMAVIPNARNV